ncbi:hypothetical protein CRE_29172 [Caenorhabditis remanei]|uniref:Uncharacterized protein n=1 Tax=Caenorhabditis remanei TaxID=31234 RepID=E3ND41_CAERE|nr:hypothetical protein CRE_29172 [Caenorhabditis remanei]
MPEGIVGNGDIKAFEDAGIEQLLMTDKPYIYRKERTIQTVRQDEEEAAEEDEVDSIADEFELLETEDLDENLSPKYRNVFTTRGARFHYFCKTVNAIFDALKINENTRMYSLLKHPEDTEILFIVGGLWNSNNCSKK